MMGHKTLEPKQLYAFSLDERVPPDHQPLGEARGASGAYVVLADDVKHGRADEAHRRRGQDKAEHDSENENTDIERHIRYPLEG